MRKKRILTVAIESRLPNLALAKIRTYYERRGYEVVQNYKRLTQRVEKVYVSCLFSWNLGKALTWLKCKYPVSLGGSGVSIYSKLPPEVEIIKPRINWGFTTRGCIRRCQWCSVHVREGQFRVTGDLLDLWDGESKKVTLLDNNILASPEQFQHVCWQARIHDIKIHFSQGLDYRLLDRSAALVLRDTRRERLWFSFDEPKNYDGVDKCISELEAVGIRQSMWFVLVGFNTTFEEDLKRINFLRRRKQHVYLTRYNFLRTPQNVLLARWTQGFKYFRKLSFSEFLSLPQNRSARKRASL